MIIGHKHWALLRGWIPPLGDESVSFMNTTRRDAHVLITIYYSHRAPAGPYRITIPAQRMSRILFNVLEDPEPLLYAADYASAIESDVPIVVQPPAIALDAPVSAFEGDR